MWKKKGACRLVLGLKQRSFTEKEKKKKAHTYIVVTKSAVGHFRKTVLEHLAENSNQGRLKKSICSNLVT